MNTKQIMVYIALFAFLIIVAFLVLPPRSPVPATTLTTSTTTRTHTNTSVQTSIPTVTTAFAGNASCISGNPTADVPNGGFSTGTYEYWNTTGQGFGISPTNLQYANEHQHYYGTGWNGYSGAYFATNYRGGIFIVAGNLTSDPFLATLPYLNFKIISAQNSRLYVQILENGVPRITTYFDTYTAPNNLNLNAVSTFVNASINLLPVLCSNVQIRVVGGAEGSLINKYNYIAVTGFYMDRYPKSAPGIIVNQSVNVT